MAARSLYFALEEQLLLAAVTEPVAWKRTDGFEPRLEDTGTVSREPLWCLSEGREKQRSLLVSLGPLSPERAWELSGP